MKRLISAIGLMATVSLAACGGNDEQSQASGELDAPEASASTPSAEPPDVSLGTTCRILFAGETGTNPLDKITILFEEESLDVAELDEINAGIEAVESAAETAQPQLAVQMIALVEQARAFLRDGLGDEPVARDTTLYKSAGLEIASICMDEL
ncbi:MAG TPA: hypothetical protein VGE38_08310 [Nocardioides sp.]|uniref:hypothetical protein n=1 Tax=Nocardioides sp. TaxID=35761 RepID=UPI002EDA2808